jgi:heat shock protein HslJ
MINMIKKLTTGFALSAILLIALAGCSGAANPLDGTQWKLVGWTLSSLDPADFSITVQFADGQISGHSGVNTYGGEYTVRASGNFSTGALMMTEMAGPQPAMRAEGAYLTLLGQARSYKLTDNQLILNDQGGFESLIFESSK